jgi:Methyltransferase domain
MPRTKKAVVTHGYQELPKLPTIKIDLGCGPHKQDGFIGLDRITFPGVDKVCDLGRDRWPFADGSVDEAFTSHFVEHLDAVERVHFANELHRVLVPGGKCTLIVPHWSSSRAYGDPTHKWPPMGEMWFMYLNQKWRNENAPHTDIKHWKQGFKCDLEATWGYGMNPVFGGRNVEFQQFAMNHYKEAVFDIHATLTKKD